MTDTQIINKYLSFNPSFKTEGNLILVEVDSSNIVDVCNTLYKTYTLPLQSVFATDQQDHIFNIFYVFGVPHTTYFLVPFIKLEDTTNFPSMASNIHELAWYEREISTFFGLTPVGYPAKLQRLILHDNWPLNIYPLRKSFKWNSRPPMSKANLYEFGVIKGEGIYEIPVGPIHAGIIEPGHFRFSVAGEEIVALEPQLGYVHKGIEKLFETLPLDQKVKLSERVSGDSSFNHSLSFCQALEKLASIQAPKRAKYLRVIYGELERLANHFNDIGFIMNDTAFTFGGSQGTRLKEIIMQINEKLTGSRFLRGVNIPGGVNIDISKEQQKDLLSELENINKDFTEVIEASRNSTSMMNRLKGSGILDKQVGVDHGVVGIPAKALGIIKDARIEYPYEAYPDLKFKIALQDSGDVYARFEVRIEEVYSSLSIIKQAIEKMPAGPITTSFKQLKKNSMAVGITEGWRGDIVYVVTTDKDANISRVAVRDPSYLNWPAVPYAVVGNPIPEFPLINKSFNLSYSGSDK